MSRYRKATLIIPLLFILCSSNSFAFRQIVLTESDSGKAITVARDDVILIELPAVFSDGYSWHLWSTDHQKLLVGELKPKPELGPGYPGKTDMQVFRLRPTDLGTSIVEFKYLQPWRKNSPLEKVFTILITVQ